MKFIWLALLGLVFGLMIMAVSLFRQTHLSTPLSVDRFAGGVEYSTQSASLLAYRLPYPGLLPDNPLYFLKMIRDRVRLWMVPQGMKKINLLISDGDKRVGASYYLASGNKIPLAYSTLLKSYAYMDQAMTAIENLDVSEEEREVMTKSLHRSLNAHIKTLSEIVLMVEGDARVQFERILDSYNALLMTTTGKLSPNNTTIETTIPASESGELEGYL
jgi:hypothetical protein